MNESVCDSPTEKILTISTNEMPARYLFDVMAQASRL